MGNQQSVKSEPKPIPNLSTLGAVPSSIRSSRKPRVPKDPQKTLGSNIFTEHNGEFPFFCYLLSLTFMQVSTGHKKNAKNKIGRGRKKEGKIFFMYNVESLCFFFSLSLSRIHCCCCNQTK
jgi:hypothetical protein